MADTLVKVENVSKKFCRSLKRSLWYGMQDISADLVGRRNDNGGRLTLRADEFWALQDVSFELKRGDCLGLIGRNGAGKSTLLKLLNGLIKPDSGRIEMHGRIGALIELGTGFNPILTGRENVYVNGSILGFSKQEIDRKFEAIAEFAEIGDFIDMPVKNYSSGMKVRLGFAVAAQMEPDVLLVDEVLAVGDTGFKQKSHNAMQAILQKAAVIFVSHSMAKVATLTNRVLVLSEGKAIYHSANVSDGVDLYLSMFGEATGGKYFDNGRARVKHLVVTTSGGNCAQNDRLEIRFRDALIVDVELEIDPGYQAVAASVYLVNQEYNPVLYCKSSDGASDFKNLDGMINFSVTIPEINLFNGSYYLMLGIKCPKTSEILIFWDRFLVIEVIGGSTGISGHLIRGDWRTTDSLQLTPPTQEKIS